MTDPETAMFQADAGQLDRLPRPGEVIKNPQSDLAIEKVAPETRRGILDAMKPDNAVHLELPNPFEGVEDAVDWVNHPPHYGSHPSGVECIRLTRHMAFDFGNAFKYVFRAPWKNGHQDYEKAQWYLRDTLEHPGNLFLPSWGQDEYRALDLVARSETDHNRIAFFHAVYYESPTMAIEAVETLIATG